MDKFVIRKSRTVQESSPIETFDDSNPQNSAKRSRIDLENLPSDPGLRQKILSYHPDAIMQRFQNMKSRRGQL